MGHGRIKVAAIFAGATVALSAGPALAAASATYTFGSLVALSASCAGQNAEVESAADPAAGNVYSTWMGCKGIAFARSTDRGSSYGTPITVPGSVGSNVNSWDPAVAVAPDGTVYAAFMIAKAADWYPVVSASFDHGATFSQVSSLLPPDHKNWGDREFIAVGPDGTVYVTWDYGPERTSVTFLCATNGSCAFATGDLNVVMQKSTDRGATWSRQAYISPGFPASGGDSAPLVIEPSGRIDVLYQGYHITDTTTYVMEPAYSYFTSSADGGMTWSAPLRLGPLGPTMSLAEWWIDGDLAIDAAGNLYATWDTQNNGEDVGWLSFSTNRGRTWSKPVQAPADRLEVPHIIQVAGGPPGVAYVGWLSSSNPSGYALFLRAFSVTSGWLSDPIQVSTQFGDTSVWPGDTFGIAALSTTEVALAWGSAVPSGGGKSEIFGRTVAIQAG